MQQPHGRRVLYILTVTVSGFVDAKGSVGITMLGRVDLQGGNSRLSLEVTARCSSKVAPMGVWSSM